MTPPDAQNVTDRFRFLVEATAWLYRPQGLWVRLQVRDKLLRDPFYRGLLATGRLPTEGVAIHFGCGRGVLLALWARALALGMIGGGKRGSATRLMGIEINPVEAESARLALAGEAEIITGDLRSETLPLCRVAILQDVLLHLECKEQDRLLQRIASNLEVGGFIILREPDASAFGHRAIARLPGKLFGMFYGDRGKPFHPRGGEEWKSLLQSFGLDVENTPTDNGKWFAKTLLLARKNIA